MFRNFFAATFALIATFFMTTIAFAAGSAVSPDDASPFELAKPVLEAVKDGKGWLAAALGVVFALAMTRRYVPKDSRVGRFVWSDVGGMLSAFLFAFAGALATSAASFGTGGSGMSLGVALAALKVGTFAIGGFIALHKLATWFTATKWYQDKAPAWLKLGVAFALAFVGSTAVAKAEKAGADAVAAAPPKGSGTFTDVE